MFVITIVRDKLKISILSSETLDYAACDFKNEKQGVYFEPKDQ
jgi:hypothetical protein